MRDWRDSIFKRREGGGGQRVCSSERMCCERVCEERVCHERMCEERVCS